MHKFRSFYFVKVALSNTKVVLLSESSLADTGAMVEREVLIDERLLAKSKSIFNLSSIMRSK